MTEHQTMSHKHKSKDCSIAPGTPVFCDVIAKTGPGGVVFSHEWRWGEHGKSEGKGSIDVPKRKPKEPGTPLHFNLHDHTDPKRHLAFAEHQKAAMWVKRDSCPPADKMCEDSEIPVDRMEVSAKTLKAFDLNDEECTLHYRLWFIGRNGKLESYDPDIRNGGKTMF